MLGCLSTVCAGMHVECMLVFDVVQYEVGLVALGPAG